MTKLPDGWEIKRLDEIADIVMGQSPPGSSYNENGEGQPFFQGKTEFGDVHPTVRKYTTAGTKFAKAGDILMSVRAPVGPTNIADIDCVIGRGLAAIRAKTVVSQSYLRWSLKHLEIDIQSKGTGTTFDAITGETLRGTFVALPPMAEQQKIVELLEDHLSRLDAALADVKQAKIKAAQFRRSLFYSVFNGLIGEFGKKVEWGNYFLGDIVENLDNRRIPVNSSERSLRLGKVPYYGATGQVGTIDKPIFDDELLLLGEDGVQFFDPDKSKAYLIAGPSWVNNHAHVLRANDSIVNQKLLMHYLNQFNYVGYANGTTRLKLTQGSMNTIPVSLPSRPMQEQMIDFIDQQFSIMDASVKAAEIVAIQSVSLRRSLLQSAFTGQLSKEILSV
jgi:type I restriction enzyme S subunit